MSCESGFEQILPSCKSPHVTKSSHCFHISYAGKTSISPIKKKDVTIAMFELAS